MHWPRNSISGMANTHLLTFQHHPKLLEPVKELLHVSKVLLPGLQSDEDIVQVHKAERQVPHHLVHELLEPLGGVSQAEQDPAELKGPMQWHGDGRLLHVLGGHRDLMVSWTRSTFEKALHPARKCVQSWRKGMGYLSGVVTLLKRLKSPQGRRPPSFLPTMCRGEAQGKHKRPLWWRILFLQLPASPAEAPGLGGPVVGMWSCTPWLGCLTENVGVVRAGLPCRKLQKTHSETNDTFSG